jgi:hypothetical protein
MDYPEVAGKTKWIRKQPLLERLDQAILDDIDSPEKPS